MLLLFFMLITIFNGFAVYHPDAIKLFQHTSEYSMLNHRYMVPSYNHPVLVNGTQISLFNEMKTIHEKGNLKEVLSDFYKYIIDNIILENFREYNKNYVAIVGDSDSIYTVIIEKLEILKEKAVVSSKDIIDFLKLYLSEIKKCYEILQNEKDENIKLRNAIQIQNAQDYDITFAVYTLKNIVVNDVMINSSQKEVVAKYVEFIKKVEKLTIADQDIMSLFYDEKRGLNSFEDDEFENKVIEDKIDRILKLIKQIHDFFNSDHLSGDLVEVEEISLLFSEIWNLLYFTAAHYDSQLNLF